MTAKILLFAFGVVALSSCSVYKSGQTPDDVYYSPAKEVTEYVRVDNDQDRNGGGYNNRNRSYDEYNEDYRNDRFMRLSMYNPSRWGAFDDYYWNNNLMFNNYYGYNSWTNPWNSYYYWNSFYNPYCSPGFIISNPYKGGGMVSTPSSKPTAFNYNAYVNRNYNNNNLYFNNGGNTTNHISSRYNNRYNTGNSNNSESNSLRRIFNNGNSNANRATYYNTNNNNSRSSNGGYNPNNNSNSQPSSRSYTPSSSSSSGGGVSSGGSSSGGGSISRPGRN